MAVSPTRALPKPPRPPLPWAATTDSTQRAPKRDPLAGTRLGARLARQATGPWPGNWHLPFAAGAVAGFLAAGAVAGIVIAFVSAGVVEDAGVFNPLVLSGDKAVIDQYIHEHLADDSYVEYVKWEGPEITDDGYRRWDVNYRAKNRLGWKILWTERFFVKNGKVTACYPR